MWPRGQLTKLQELSFDDFLATQNYATQDLGPRGFFGQKSPTTNPCIQGNLLYKGDITPFSSKDQLGA